MARKKVKNFDPSRTKTLRNTYYREIRKRTNQLKRNLKKWLVTDDELALIPREPFKFNRRQYEFSTDPGKLEAFKQWLTKQIDDGILESSASTPWTSTYVDSAYRKGVVRAYTDTRKESLSGNLSFYEGSKAQFLADAFAAPETISKLQLIYTRNYDMLVGFTADMAAQASRIMANGIGNGYSPSRIAREMTQQINTLTRIRARRIARTEVIHAHAEGQLDGFERLGVEEVGLLAEWMTAGDNRVCPRCAPRNGVTYTIQEARGLIPLHPNCRCAWAPASQFAKRKRTRTRKTRKNRKK